MIEDKKKAYLFLDDGSVYHGKNIGSEKESNGEVVFNTSMTGYQEMLTDPSYKGQILIATYPLIGNYGINPYFSESNNIQVSGFIVRSLCDFPSHNLSTLSLGDFLIDNNIPGISDIDTRSITKKIRSKGVMKGLITLNNDEKRALKILKSTENYDQKDLVSSVSTKTVYEYMSQKEDDVQRKFNIVLLDLGVKRNILRILDSKGCKITVLPWNSSAKTILGFNPDGIVFSPGPGDPSRLDDIVKVVKEIIGSVPIMGICLGHQIIARAFGFDTFKLHFGHRGGNQPVKDLMNGKVYPTAQNHGYAVKSDVLNREIEVSHMNLNDQTISGLINKKDAVITIQYHSEASPGPQDSEYLFNEFITIIKNFNKNKD
ncbi:MAG: carbamoyl phosphate synthase small subunit [Chloroflexi bacterium]|nr:carbamoyl phosphate synthase small subunit [Chloroflexota bacterium]|tara:strand:- start:28369 stop:29487 length:1119 start_codon:yes stop_codon:yes gene_type:complete